VIWLERGSGIRGEPGRLKNACLYFAGILPIIGIWDHGFACVDGSRALILSDKKLGIKGTTQAASYERGCGIIFVNYRRF
jgi:hypothetical protein